VFHSTLGLKVIKKKKKKVVGVENVRELPSPPFERGHDWRHLRSEAGSYLRFIDSCITQLKVQGPSRTCNESKEEEEEDIGGGC